MLALIAAVEQLRAEYDKAKNDPAFHAELNDLLKHYVGRPSPVYHARRWSEMLGGAQIYLKREDLNHTGAHKINNTLGQVLLGYDSTVRVTLEEMLHHTRAVRRGNSRALLVAEARRRGMVPEQDKIAALAHHKTQMGKTYADPAVVRSMARFRGNQVRAPLAEGFEAVRVLEKASVVNAITSANRAHPGPAKDSF